MLCVEYFAQIIVGIDVNHHAAVIFCTANQQFRGGLSAGYDFRYNALNRF